MIAAYESTTEKFLKDLRTMRLLTDKKSYKKFKKVIKVKALLKGYKVVWQLVFAKFAHELELAYFP